MTTPKSTPAPHPIALPDGRGGVTVYMPTGHPAVRVRPGALGTTVTMPADIWRVLLKSLLPTHPAEPSVN